MEFSPISDFNLKRILKDYYPEIYGIKFIGEYFYNCYTVQIVPFIFTEYNVLKGNLKNPDLKNTLQFSDSFTGYSALMQQKNAAYSQLLNKALVLRDELKNLKIKIEIYKNFSFIRKSVELISEIIYCFKTELIKIT